MEAITEKYTIINGLVGDIMTQEELNKMIDEIIIPQEKPKNTGNSHKRKQWENQKNWRLCTIGQTCKLGSFKDYNELYNFYEQFDNYVRWVDISFGSFLGGIYYINSCKYFKHYSCNKKWLRKVAEERVRNYKCGISNGSMYRKIFDYFWECD